jgi:hypothetical protein
MLPNRIKINKVLNQDCQYFDGSSHISKDFRIVNPPAVKDKSLSVEIVGLKLLIMDKGSKKRLKIRWILAKENTFDFLTGISKKCMTIHRKGKIITSHLRPLAEIIAIPGFINCKRDIMLKA